VESDIFEWPAAEIGFRAHIGPFGESLYIVPGLSAGGDAETDILFAGASVGLLYMLPAGDRFVPFLEAGVTGTAIRIDVLDFTEHVIPPESDRTTYIRGGIQVGAGLDIALGGNWSVTTAARVTFLGDIDTQHAPRDGMTVTTDKNPSYWELPRIAIVYWY
jgi:opacity protein-like surface antigen